MPYGRNGFAELGVNMPDGMSLISLLKERGYISRFFYGGDATFDNMKLFLTKQHIDYVIEVFGWLAKNRKNIKGLEVVEAPAILPHFTAKLKPAEERARIKAQGARV